MLFGPGNEEKMDYLMSDVEMKLREPTFVKKGSHEKINSGKASKVNLNHPCCVIVSKFARNYAEFPLISAGVHPIRKQRRVPHRREMQTTLLLAITSRNCRGVGVITHMHVYLSDILNVPRSWDRLRRLH